MRSPLPALPSLLALVLLSSACSIVPSVRATPRIGSLKASGNFRASSGGSSASADVQDLGLDKDNAVFEPRVDVAVGPVDVVVSGYDTSLSGNGVADVTLDLGGATITQGEAVASRLDLTSAGVLATWDLVPTDLVDFGLGLGVQDVQIDGRVDSLTSGQRIDTSKSFPLPVVAARAAVHVFDLELSGVASGLSLDAGGVDATYVDLDLMASWTFERFLGFHGALVGGWRQVSVKAAYGDGGSDVDFDFDLSGPYIGLTLGL